MLEATQQMLQGANISLPIPLVIRLVQYVRLPHRRVPVMRARDHAARCLHLPILWRDAGSHRVDG